MKRSAWLRIIAVILIISMVAAPVSAVGAKGSTGTRNPLIGNIADMIRDLFRDRFGGSFGQPGEEPTTPSNPVDPTAPTEPGETEPEDSESEISLELIEGHANVENGHLLRGVTYSLTELMAEYTNPPFSLRNDGFGASSLGGGTAGSLSLGRTPLNAMAETETIISDSALEITYDDAGNAVIDSGDYVLGFDGGKYLTNVEGSTDWGTTLTSTANKDAATIWTITRQDDGTYTIQDPNDKYFAILAHNDAAMSDTVIYMAIQSNTNNTVIKQLNTTEQKCFVNALGGVNTGAVGGWTDGTPMKFYAVTAAVDPSDSTRDIPLPVLTATAENYQSGDDPDHVLDEDNGTIWHTVHRDSERATHWIQIELSEGYKVDGLRYLPRQDSGTNGNITGYEVQVSNDGQTFRTVATGTWDGNSEWKLAQFTEEQVKYVRLVATSALPTSGNKFASAAEIRLTGTKVATPSEPEQPAIGSELVYFPVTMFNYNNGISELNDDDIMRTLTHQAEVEAGLKEKWEGLYFSGGKPAPTPYTYTTEAASHSDLSWQQVMDGTYYADEACTEQVTVEEVSEGGSEWNAVTINNGGSSYVNFTEYADGNYYYKNGENYEVITKLEFAWGGWYAYTADSDPDSYYVSGNELTIYTRGGEPVDYKLVAGGETLKNLGGTDLTAKVGVPLYTAASEVTVNKSYAEWNWWAYETDGDAARNKFYAGLVQDELVDGELKFNVAEPGIFTFDSAHPEITNDGIKDIYQNVGLPFVKNAKGYYTFDSDANGTYFADTTGDGKSDPWYGAEDDYFNMYFDYNQTQGWSGMYYGDGSSNLWAPYNTNANDTGEGAIDYHFGLRADIPFSMTPNGRIKSNDDNSEPITFTFKGDDDVWIFIDGHLVIDLGGIHNRLGATIDFANNTITYFKPESNTNTNEFGAYNVEDFELVQKLYNDADGEGALGQTRANFSTVVDHEMSIFYLERGKGTSNCQIEFNLPMLDTVLVTKDITHSWSALQDERDGEDGDGTALLTAKEQAAVDKLDFDFKLWKKEIGGRYTAVANTNYYLLDKDDNVLGIYTTGADGIFSLKNGQTAMFLTDLGNGTITYAVEELNLDLDTFLTPDYKFAGLTTNGFDFYGETLNTETPDENDTKRVDTHLTGNASEIGEQELPMDAVQLVSYDVTPYGSIEAIESLEFICTNYLNADLPSPSARTYEDIIVIDYGLPVQIDPLANDLFRGENIEIVAWGDESLELNEVLESNQIYAVPYGDEGGTTWSGNKVLAAAYVSNGTTYSSTPVDMADCLYTFKKNADGTYEIFSTAADGTKVYLNQYTTDLDRVPNDSIPGKISVSESTHENMFRLLANAVEGGSGSNRTLHFHSDAAMPFWNRCGNDTSKKCSEYLYRPASANDQSSTEIPGYVMVTSLDEIKDGGQYLIVHDSDVDSNLYVLHPSTSNSQWDHVAKVGTTTSPAIGTSFSFDSGNVTFKDKTYAEYEHKNEKNETYYTYDRDTFEYELTEQLTEVEEIRYIIKVNSTVEEDIGDETVTNTACRYALGKIYIAPATIMYYEENFSDMILFEGSGWNSDSTVANTNNVSPYQEPGVVGTVGDSTYGSDVAYLSDNGDSNGTHRKGDTTDGAIRFTYTFTGTGTTIFARTSDKTGYMQVKIYDGEDTSGELMNISYRDTYWKDTNEVNEGGSTLYSIPVFTDEDLDYGTYTVVCTVAKAGTRTDGNENGAGNEFYLDGIRIMQPLNVDAQNQELVEKTLDAYVKDNEANLDVVTLRQKLLTDYPTIDGEPEEDEIIESEEAWPFVVLTDVDDQIVLASDYKSIGPKEEVYLAATDTGIANAQTVSFSLKFWEPEGLKLYMGMKAPFGSAKVNIGHKTYELNNAPDCYYDVTDQYASLIQEQATDDYGNLLYLDQNGNEIYEVVNEDKTKSYYYVGSDVACSGENIEPILLDSYIITFTFEAAESIVSLTNIKVVGNHEFTIIEGEEISQ